GKIFNAEEAAAVVNQLNPKRVIPVQYVNGETPEGCDQEGVQPFLDAMGGTAVRRVGRTQTLPGRLDDTTVITVMQ
ncbi:MAG: Zn-dependent hydrolase, partial [Synechococcus sp.]